MRLAKTRRVSVSISYDLKLCVKRKGHRYRDFKKLRSNTRAHEEMLPPAPSSPQWGQSLLSTATVPPGPRHHRLSPRLLPQLLTGLQVSTDGLVSTQQPDTLHPSKYPPHALGWPHLLPLSPVAPSGHTHVLFLKTLNTLGLLLPKAWALAESRLFPQLRARLTPHPWSFCPDGILSVMSALPYVCQSALPALLSSVALSTF